MSAFEIDTSDLQRLARQSAEAPKVVRTELLTAMRGVGFDAERYAKIAAPVDRNELRQKITSVAKPVSGGVQAIVGTSAKHGEVVEKGRGRGKQPPPTAPIAAWLIRHDKNPKLAYVVARAIGKRGITARPYLKPAVERAVRESGRHMRPMIARIETRLFR